MSGDDSPDFSAVPAPAPIEGVRVSPTIVPSRFERLLGGVQTGVAAFCLSLLWLGFISRLEGRSFWTIPNLMAGAFHGVRSVRPEFHPDTWPGLALHLLLCVGLAALAAQIIRPDGRLLRSLAAGILLSTAWFYLWDGFFWRYAFPPFAIYSKRPAIFFGHVLIGLCVGLYSIFVRPFRAPENRV
jgi:hypothetical protein